MRKDELKCTCFKTETEDHSIGRSLNGKKHGGTGLVSEKTEASYAEGWMP